MDDRKLLHLVLILTALSLATNALVLRQVRSANVSTGGPPTNIGSGSEGIQELQEDLQEARVHVQQIKEELVELEANLNSVDEQSVEKLDQLQQQLNEAMNRVARIEYELRNAQSESDP